MRPTVAEVRLDALRHNYRLLRAAVEQHAGPTAALVAVVKADGYGHGAVACGRTLVTAEGCPWLGVTDVAEAGRVRPALGSPHTRLLVMSGFFPGEEGAVLTHALTPHVWEGYHFALLDAAGRRRGAAPASIPVHLEIDTGMSRQGAAPGEALSALLRTAGLAGPGSPLFVEGVLTHFAAPEDPDTTTTDAQLRCFAEGLAQLREAGIRPRWIHAGNSATAAMGSAQLAPLRALARSAGASLLVRPGLSLYGIAASAPPPAARLQPLPESPATGPVANQQPPAEAAQALPLRPVLSWHTALTSTRTVPPGTCVGYHGTFRASRSAGTRLGLLPVGYADGFPRRLSNRGAVLVRGQRAPVVGRVSMDQTVVDLSAIPEATLGDPVVLLGTQGAAAIPVEELAGLCDTISYEVLCGIAPRVPRQLVRE